MPVKEHSRARINSVLNVEEEQGMVGCHNGRSAHLAVEQVICVSCMTSVATKTYSNMHVTAFVKKLERVSRYKFQLPPPIFRQKLAHRV
jgi:hypothetical protein